MAKYNTKETARQVPKAGDILRDGNTRKENPWREKKLAAIARARAYRAINAPRFARRAERIEGCAPVLTFRYYVTGERKLHHAAFCRVPLCPLCMWRRSLKIFGQVSKIMTEIEKTDSGLTPLFLTLTVKNVCGHELAAELSHLFKAVNLLTKYKAFVKSVTGWFRSLEVTYNAEVDTYHPHFHLILLVRKSYFTQTSQYISQEKWVELWSRALKADYLPSVNIKRARNIHETTKYVLKDNGAINAPKVIETLDLALDHRRLIGYGGIMKETWTRLQLEDAEKGSLIHIGEDAIRLDVNYIIKKYNWTIGARNYVCGED